MLYLRISVRLISVCIGNASASFHEYGDNNSIMTSHQKA